MGKTGKIKMEQWKKKILIGTGIFVNSQYAISAPLHRLTKVIIGLTPRATKN